MDFISFDEGNRTVREFSEKNKKNVNWRKSKLSRHQKDGGVIYLGHIPHGFYEDEMKSYFSQFGKVIAATVSRSKKTGRSRGYGFVQFQDEEVAKIAAEAMNNYLMYNRIIKCRYIPPEERKKKIYENKINVSNYPRQRNRKIELRNKKKALSKLSQTTYLQKVQKKIDELKVFFEKNGVDFTFKINDESSQNNSTDNENKKIEAKTSSNLNEKSENEMDDINGVLEIDESDNEIFFKTPPQVKKVFKKSLNSPALPEKDFISSNNSLIKKVAKNNSSSNKIQKQEKSKKKKKVSLLNETEKNKETGRNSKKIKKDEVIKETLNKKKWKSLSKKKVLTQL